MILSKVYEDAERRLERNEITLGEFGRLVDIEVIEPKRGEWIDVWQDGICSWRGTCSVCRSTNDIPPPFEANFCPSCGARMKGADDE